MRFDLSDKKAIVSGSTAGIGYAIAKGLAKCGAHVLINGRDEHRVDEAIVQMRKEIPGARVDGLAADLSRLEGIEKMKSFWPEADILVNNLGIYEPRNFFEIDDDEWERFFQTNVMTAVRLTRHYAKGMVDRGWGRVTFNASVTGGFFPGEMVHYGATKAALLGLSRGVAESVAGTGVTVNAFIPGPTKTEKTKAHIMNMAEQVGKPLHQFEKEMFQQQLPFSLIQRFCTPEEVANLVVFLSSNEAGAITGAALHVDGGIIRSIL